MHFVSYFISRAIWHVVASSCVVSNLRIVFWIIWPIKAKPFFSNGLWFLLVFLFSNVITALWKSLDEISCCNCTCCCSFRVISRVILCCCYSVHITEDEESISGPSTADSVPRPSAPAMAPVQRLDSAANRTLYAQLRDLEDENRR